MHPHNFLRCLLALCVLFALPASAQAPPTAPQPAAPPVDRLPLVVVHKSPTCGCCTSWAAHMRQAGFPVQLRDENELGQFNSGPGVAAGKHYCPTTQDAGNLITKH